VPRLCVFYPGICLTTEEKAGKNLNEGKKTIRQVKKNLRVQYTYYQNTHTNTHITKQYKTTTVVYRLIRVSFNSFRFHERLKDV